LALTAAADNAAAAATVTSLSAFLATAPGSSVDDADLSPAGSTVYHMHRTSSCTFIQIQTPSDTKTVSSVSQVLHYCESSLQHVNTKAEKTRSHYLVKTERPKYPPQLPHCPNSNQTIIKKPS